MNQNRYFSRTFAALAMAVLTCAPLVNSWAQEEKPVDVMIEQLGSGSFQERNEASLGLIAAGAEAIPALLKTATSEDTEVRRRTVVILDKLARNPDKAIVAAFEKLAEEGDASFKELAETHFDLAQRTLLGEVAKDQMAKLGLHLEMEKGGIQLTSRTGETIRVGPAPSGDSGQQSMTTAEGLDVLVTYKSSKHVIVVTDAKGTIWMQYGTAKDGKTTVHCYQFESTESMKGKNPRIYAEYEKVQNLKNILEALEKLRVAEQTKEHRGADLFK